MPELSRTRAAEILKRARDRRVVVLGDVMLDEFIWGDVTRISPEAPVPVVNIKRESMHLGGAANVLANITALGAAGNVIGVVGKDSAAEKIRESLRKDGGGQTDDMLIADDKRPTTIKTRIIAHNQMVVRADREHRGAVNGNVESEIVVAARVAISNADALVISDYDKGVITPRILSEVLPAAYDQMPVLIDPKMRNFDSYRPATLLTPNHHEALRVTNLEEDSDETLSSAARSIRKRLACDAVLITRGERGMMLLEGDHDPVFVKTAAREVFDVTGAGDTVIATLAVALASGASMTEAAVLANHAAGIVVGKLGTATADAKEIIQSFE
ncbi:MAG TPA: D-glycero-beta-D-manno-heptose-7-phosphate kinase [Pyrinomonadaceae bacterium]|nr:D-glycero-beta-D-manno-heptose-7-phosphate kinase [Pyrinomonadaceae bacterium]